VLDGVKGGNFLFEIYRVLENPTELDFEDLARE
jgi:hypothetical protein